MKFRLFGAAMLFALLFPSAATAHEQLVDQQPKAGEVVSAGVVEILLDFSSDLINLENSAGSEIVILDANGDPVNNGCAVIEGPRAIAKADIDVPGSYLVGWRVVSGDGHPISGSFNFEVENTTGYVSDPEYVFATCANPYDPDSSQITKPVPEYLYWLLWASMPIAAAVLFFLLRPKNRPSHKTRSSED